MGRTNRACGVFALCVVLLIIDNAKAQATRATLNPLPSLIECEVANITWSGGVPPYNLDITPVNRTTSIADKSMDTQYIGIMVPWHTWTPNYTGGTLIQFFLIDSTPARPSGGSGVVEGSSDTSCLLNNSAPSSSSSQLPSSSMVMSTATPSNVATIPPTPSSSEAVQPVTASTTHHGLSGGAIAGIVVAVAVLAILGMAVITWWCLRRRSRARASGDFDRALATSPALSDTSTAVTKERYSTFSSIVPKLKSRAYTASTAPTITQILPYSEPGYFTSPETVDIHPDLRPTPYMVPRSESPVGSDMRKGTKIHQRDISATSADLSTTDFRSVSPFTSGYGSPLPSPGSPAVRLEMGSQAGPENGQGHGPQGGATSESGTSTTLPPPPYSTHNRSESRGDVKK